MLDRDTGEIVEKMLTHEGAAVREFYASIPPPVVVGIEATTRCCCCSCWRRSASSTPK